MPLFRANVSNRQSQDELVAQFGMGEKNFPGAIHGFEETLVELI